MTETNTKQVFKVIFAWEDEKEEKWLEQMAAGGWHLQGVMPFYYSFVRGASEKVIYRLDYKMTLDKDYSDYSTIFEDSGWELVTVMGNWHYYRLNPSNERIPEIYNTNRAKAQKYRRLLLGLIPFLPIYLVIFNPAFSLLNRRTGEETSLFLVIVQLLMFVLILFFIYAVIRILHKIRKLESQSKE
jgi:lipopolysaccharide export LptBFGC system permease protein LptF